MSLGERCWDCQELPGRCVCGLDPEAARAKKKRSLVPSREAQVAAFVRNGPRSPF